MSEKFLSHIIALLNRAQPDGLTFDALTFHLYNSQQDFFDVYPDMRSIATKLRLILETYSTHIICDDHGAYHVRKGIPQQLSINFDAPQETIETEITLSQPNEEDFGEQLYLDLFEDTTPEQQPLPSSPYSFPTLFDDAPDFI